MERASNQSATKLTEEKLAKEQLLKAASTLSKLEEDLQEKP